MEWVLFLSLITCVCARVLVVGRVCARSARREPLKLTCGKFPLPQSACVVWLFHKISSRQSRTLNFVVSRPALSALVVFQNGRAKDRELTAFRGRYRLTHAAFLLPVFARAHSNSGLISKRHESNRISWRSVCLSLCFRFCHAMKRDASAVE
jgi:hypothetical protein